MTVGVCRGRHLADPQKLLSEPSFVIDGRPIAPSAALLIATATRNAAAPTFDALVVCLMSRCVSAEPITYPFRQFCAVLLRRDSTVTRETLFNAVTNEAYDTLLSVAPFPSGYNADPLNLTLAMQLSVLSGSAENVAWLLTNYNDSRALGLGLRFPPELRKRALQTTDERMNDGDVVVMKGIAMAALDPFLASRLSDVYNFASYGERKVACIRDYSKHIPFCSISRSGVYP